MRKTEIMGEAVEEKRESAAVRHGLCAAVSRAGALGGSGESGCVNE